MLDGRIEEDSYEQSMLDVDCVEPSDSLNNIASSLENDLYLQNAFSKRCMIIGRDSCASGLDQTSQFTENSDVGKYGDLSAPIERRTVFSNTKEKIECDYCCDSVSDIRTVKKYKKLKSTVYTSKVHTCKADILTTTESNLNTRCDKKGITTSSAPSPVESYHSKNSSEYIERIKHESESSYLELLLEPDGDGDTLIFVAILLQLTDLCAMMIALIPSQSLIQKTRNNMFQTALHLAALTDNAKLARRFLVAGVEVDLRDMLGNTALHIACKRGNKQVAEALLNHVTYTETKQNLYEITYQRVPQNLEIRNFEGQTCLLIAARNNDIAIMDLLISKNADVNAVDSKSGMTCLHILTELGHVEKVKYLIKHRRVNVNAKTYSGFTALEIANYRGHSFIAYMLLCAGAKPRLRPGNSKDFLADSDTDSDDDMFMDTEEDMILVD